MQSFKEEAKENKFGDTSMIFLIKAGCFDRIENKDRREIMMNFIKIITPNLNSLRYTNIEDLNDLGFLTIEQQKNELRWFRFRQYIFDKKFFAGKKGKSATTEYYYLEPKFAEPYFRENFAPDMEEDSDYFYDDNNMFCVKRGSFDRVFKKKMENFKEEKLDNEEVLQKVYIKKVNQEWEDKKLNSTTAKWEMDSLSYYYGEHELAKVNRETYNISNFNDLSPKGEIAGWFYYKNQKKPRFALTRLCGTVVSKNKNKGSLALSTPDGVVTIKLYKGQFGFYDKQISEIDEDTSKKTVLEKSWFFRGTKLLITGYRRDDQFVAKKYNDSIYRHSIQLISSINDDGTLNLISERVGQEDE